jgi:hypothetical protein
MNKNRIGGLRWRASGQVVAKPISIKLTGGKSGGCASKAAELTSGICACHGIVTAGEVIRPTMAQKSAAECRMAIIDRKGGTDEDSF